MTAAGRRAVSGLCALFLFAGAPALAQQGERNDCRATAETERDMAACLKTLITGQGTTMAGLIRTLKKRYVAPEEKNYAPIIDKAQRSWVAWRDAECDLKTFDSRGGSGFTTLLLSCRFELNGERLKVLKEMEDSP